MSVSPPGHWLLNRMVFLLNRTLGIINSSVLNSIINLLKDANTFTGINTFKGGINVDNIDSINGNTTFNSEIIVNSNITANNGSFIGDNLVINIIEKNTNSNVTFQSNINMNNKDIDNINNLISGNLYIKDIFKSSNLQQITVQDDIIFNKGINVNGNLTVEGSIITVNSKTLTIDDRFIVLNANIESSGKFYTDPAGIIVDTHNTTEHSRGYLLWTLFDSNDPTNTELNRTWDLSGDNLRGNVLKATTLRGNILDSYYSPNISVISDIDMSNHDISNINILTASDINIDVIKTNIASNISVMNTIDMNSHDISNINTLTASDLNIHVIKTNITSNISVMNTIDMNNNYIINANISALNHSQIKVEGGLINTRNLILGEFDSQQPNGVQFRARSGINTIGNKKLNIWKGSSDTSYTLFLPENNGQTTENDAKIIGENEQTNTQSILGIGAFYKQQNSLQSLNNSQCYLIPPSMISSELPELKGNTLFKTIGEQTGNIRYLAGYSTANIEINELKNSLVPTVGQIVDLLNYLDVSMNTSKAHNLKSSY